MSDSSEYVDKVLARAYWQAVGLAENARSERRSHAESAYAFAAEEAKWQRRADEALARLGGEVPQNPLPGEIEDALKPV